MNVQFELFYLDSWTFYSDNLLRPYSITVEEYIQTGGRIVVAGPKVLINLSYHFNFYIFHLILIYASQFLHFSFILFWWWIGFKISEISRFVFLFYRLFVKMPKCFFFGKDWVKKKKLEIGDTFAKQIFFFFFFTFKTCTKTRFGKIFSKPVFTNFLNNLF